jgi:hypothetical protein
MSNSRDVARHRDETRGGAVVFKTIAALIIVPVAIVSIVAARRPDSFRVVRTVSIQAPPERIFPLINDLHRWEEWSPYEKKDPAMERAYSGPSTGKGAVFAFDGNGEVGMGRVEIIEASADSSVGLSLDMFEPFRAHNVVAFSLHPEGDTTTVTWAIEGQSPFFGKLIGLVFDVDRMIGRDFEVGLANLKTIAETEQVAAAHFRELADRSR